MTSFSRRVRRSEVDKQLSPWSVRRIASWSLFALALLIAGQHLLAHAGWAPIPIGMGWQDILIGYPMAAVLAIVGLIVMDPNPRL